MRKLGIFCIIIVVLLCGCKRTTKKEQEMLNNYKSFMEAIIDNKGAESANIPFEHRLEVKKNKDGLYEYTVTIHNPKVAMYDIEMMVLNKNIDADKEWMPNLGLTDDANEKYTMIPFQSKKEDGYYSGIQLSGQSSSPKFTLNVMVTWKDYAKLNTTRAFFNYTYEDQGEQKVGTQDSSSNQVEQPTS